MPEREERTTLFGLPVVESSTTPHDEIRIVAGRGGVLRQDGVLEWEPDGVWRVTNIGEPYDA